MAGRPREKNRYKICGDDTILYLDRRDGSQIEAIIDTKDLEKVINFKHKWHYTRQFYGNRYYVTTTIYHGIIDGKPKYTTMKLNYFLMDCPEGMEVDHKDNNSLNNKKNNLRVTDRKSNSRNRKAKNSNNTSGHRNVSLDKKTNEWMVQLQDVDGKTKCFKRFPYEQLEEAGKYAEEKRKELYGEFAGKD